MSKTIAKLEAGKNNCYSRKVRFTPRKTYTATRNNGSQVLYMGIVKRLPRKKAETGQALVVRLAGYSVDNNWGYIEGFTTVKMDSNTEVITYVPMPELGKHTEPFVFRADHPDEETKPRIKRTKTQKTHSELRIASQPCTEGVFYYTNAKRQICFDFTE